MSIQETYTMRSKNIMYLLKDPAGWDLTRCYGIAIQRMPKHFGFSDVMTQFRPSIISWIPNVDTKVFNT